MKRMLMLLLVLCLVLTGCTAGNGEKTDGSSAATPSPAPTATPSPTPEETEDIDPYDEADYYFDFGQDDLIQLSYEVTWPQQQMTEWSVQENARVGALLTLQKDQSTITVMMEDAPEYADLNAFMVYAKQMFTFTYENAAPEREAETENGRLLAGTLEDGGTVQWLCSTVNGLYVTCEVVARGEDAQTDLETFENTFCPGVQFTYTEICSLQGCHGEE